ncbi:MAG: hypothetical protein DRI84_07635 [Bacteroidetes bacterium]|nr:MAG: hypothetical protein DRI84_07635 [Bacteroidota bacterium]
MKLIREILNDGQVVMSQKGKTLKEFFSVARDKINKLLNSNKIKEFMNIKLRTFITEEDKSLGNSFIGVDIDIDIDVETLYLTLVDAEEKLKHKQPLFPIQLRIDDWKRKISGYSDNINWLTIESLFVLLDSYSDLVDELEKDIFEIFHELGTSNTPSYEIMQADIDKFILRLLDKKVFTGWHEVKQDIQIRVLKRLSIIK